ncbi:class I SAM-dependent methyltransferase [Chloroflexota bacterium]
MTNSKTVFTLIGHLIYKSMGTTNFIRRIEWRSILEWLEPNDGEKVLDAACGSGILSLKIAEKGYLVNGIDISVDAISSAKRLAEREKIAADFEVGNAEHLPYSDSYFDKVVCSSSLEHFYQDIGALKEMNRVLKPNGILVLTTDSVLYLSDNKLGERHKKKANVVNYYDQERLKKRLEISGFRTVRSKYLCKSPMARFFIKLWVEGKVGGLLGVGVSLLASPLSLPCERLFSAKKVGYTLIAEARKIGT